MARKAPPKSDQIAALTADETIAVVNEVPTPAIEMAGNIGSRCGGALRHAREKQNLTVHEISSRLRIGNNQVEAIEADQFDKLPQPTIVRGFIRNYAKTLRIDAEPLLAAYHEMVPNASPQSFTVKPTADSSVIGVSSHALSFKTIAMIIACALLAGALFYYYNKNIKPSTTNNIGKIEAHTPESVTEVAPSPSVEFALPPAERAPTTPEPESKTIPSGDATSLQNPVTQTTLDNAKPISPTASDTATKDSVTKENSTLPLSNLPATPLPITENVAKPKLKPETSINAIAPQSLPAEESLVTPQKKQGSELTFNASEETWVNVTNANGKEIFSKVLSAGSTETISAKPPLKVTIGNARSTTLTMNGEVIDLTAHTRDKVARLKLN